MDFLKFLTFFGLLLGVLADTQRQRNSHNDRQAHTNTLKHTHYWLRERRRLKKQLKKITGREREREKERD